MADSYISFYLKANRIHIFVDVLREIGSPKRICFMLDESGNSLIVAPYSKKDFKSHSIPKDVYKGIGSMEISSIKLCRIIANIQNWDLEHSYRIPGTIVKSQNVAVFQLERAELITRNSNRDFFRTAN